MARDSIPTLDLREYTNGDQGSRAAFIQKMGEALEDIGFFALTGHGIPLDDISQAYAVSEEFFDKDDSVKMRWNQSGNQRGYVPFGVEHAKDNPAPDLKEFWQTGRTLSDGHAMKEVYATNIWPTEDAPEFEPAIDGLYIQMEELSRTLLEVCSEYLGKGPNWLPDMAIDGNTILRILHYPALGADVPDGAVRSAQHEDINFITLLVGASADGLEVMDHDGEWIKVQGNHEHIIIDSGDMLQNLTNGLFKAVTHRVVNPPDSTSDRYSMPMFTHPRDDVDLTPRPEFIARTGGEALYPSISAGEFLRQRLIEIGLIKDD
ncbi:MAG: 2-oxoglutarate and iron-dependent oxygenase domain-containing protein [Candidatus Thalassarchaeaceae archaeon]|jgi:isopenicillin N synthase-like dioxygenase|nr:2-oxoglutarate and iron-dependent oxygenase domain-containing protein [Candidatus Thalassarchaeaceae archaeon]